MIGETGFGYIGTLLLSSQFFYKSKIVQNKKFKTKQERK